MPPRASSTFFFVWLMVSCANWAPRATDHESHISLTNATATLTEQTLVTNGGTTRLTVPSAGAVGSGTAEPALALVQPGPTASKDPAADPMEPPALRDAGGNPLPQTDDLPSLDSPWLKHRVEQLFAAIVADDAEIARSAFFPLIAYEQVKAINQPARDWQHRLFAAFRRDIHEYHRQLGSEPTKARLLGLGTSATQPARWMKPGSEGNKLGYHRLLRAGLNLTDSSGRKRQLEITSMISWRGEWYIVHLHGFK